MWLMPFTMRVARPIARGRQRRMKRSGALSAIEALKGDEPISQLAKNNGVTPKQIRKWREDLVSNAAKLFQ